MSQPKKRKRKVLKEAELDLPLVPLIDVLMQLLIFFMCGTKFRTLEGKLLSHLPKDIGINSSSVPSPNMNEVRIKLIYDDKSESPLKTKIDVERNSGNNTGTVKHITGDPKSHADWKELSSEVARQFEEVKAKNLDMPFIIDPESKIPMQAVIYALDACRQANILDVRFAGKTAPSDSLDDAENKKP